MWQECKTTRIEMGIWYRMETTAEVQARDNLGLDQIDNDVSARVWKLWIVQEKARNIDNIKSLSG